MYKLYNKPVTKVSPDIKIPEPRVSKLALLLARPLGRIYLFLFFGVSKIVLSGNLLFDAFKRALAEESRCILAFRHPNGGESQILCWLTLFKLRSLAAKKGIRFARKPHAVFVYGYEVVRWGGWLPRLIMPNLGAVPVHHSKIDTKGMNRIYETISEGPYPLALAPEGQVSYLSDSIPRIEPGVIRIGFNAALQMAEKNIKCPVEILPVSFHFRFGGFGKASMERLLRKIEKYCGFSQRINRKLPFEERLRNCRDHILEINEKRYNINAGDSLSFEERLEKLAAAALETAERMLGISSAGDFFARLYKVRHVCWDRIFLPGFENLKDMPPVERSLKDLAAGEAWYISRHQELADFGWYFRCPIPTDETALHVRVEYIQNLFDFANRTMGGAISGRKKILLRKVVIKAAPAINLSERLHDYKENKKAAIAAALSDLEKAYLDCISEINELEKD